MYIPHGGTWLRDEDINIHEKSKVVSCVFSWKNWNPYHRMRFRVYDRLKDDGRVDFYGSGCEKEIEFKIDALKDYMFSIVIENCVESGYFTEKILDCFLTGTIPVYVGSRDTSNYFDENGITIKYYDAAGLEDQYLDYNDSNAAFAEAGINYVLPNEYKILDVNNVIKSAGLGSQQTIPMTTDVTVGGEKKAVVVKEPVLKTLRRVLEEDGALSASTFKNEAGEMLNEDKAQSIVAGAIASIPGLTGYTVEQHAPGKNQLKLTSSVEDEPDIILDLDNQSAESLKDKLYAQAVANIPKDETTLALYTNGRGKSSGGMGKYVKP